MVETDAVLLARIDERTKATAETMTRLEAKIEAHYVSQDEFEPIKKLTYGLVSLMLASIVTGVLALIFKPWVIR